MKRDNFDYLSKNIVFSADWLNLKLEGFESVTKFFSLLESLPPAWLVSPGNVPKPVFIIILIGIVGME